MDSKLVLQLKGASKLTVSKEKLKVTLEIDNAENRMGPVTQEEIYELLAINNIKFGVKQDAVRQVLSELAEGVKYIGPVVVAEGTPPKAGEKGELRLAFGAQLKVGEAGKEGRVDYRERGAVKQVSAGDILAEVKFPVPGKPGRDVENQPVPPGEVEPLQLPEAGEGVTYDHTSGTYTACVAGSVSLKNNRITVSEKVTIPGDVNYEVGNIHFSGDVTICGNVCKGFIVEAGGYVLTKGGVEPKAKVTGAKGVTVKGPIRGPGKNGSFSVCSEGDVTACDLTYCAVFAKGDVTVRGHIINTRIEALGTFTNSGYNSEFRGSTIEAVGGIKVASAGSEGGAKNTLIAGITAGAAARISEIEAELSKLFGHRYHIYGSFYTRHEALLTKVNLSEAEKTELREARLEAGAKQEDLERRIRELKEERRLLFENYLEDCNAVIEVEGEIYPPAEIKVYKKDYLLSSKKRTSVIFYFTGKRVACESLESYALRKRRENADPNDLATRFKAGRLNPAELLNCLELYNATGTSAVLQTALQVELEAVKQRDFQDANTWTQMGITLASIALFMSSDSTKATLMNQALRAADKVHSLAGDSPGQHALRAMLAECKTESGEARNEYRKALGLLADNRGRFGRDVWILAVYARFLHKEANRLQREGKNQEAQVACQRAEEAAQEYLSRRPQGPWAAMTREIVEGVTVCAT